MRMTNNLYFYKIHSEVKDPVRATEGSACFDLHASLPKFSVVKVYENNFEEVDKLPDTIRGIGGFGSTGK